MKRKEWQFSYLIFCCITLYVRGCCRRRRRRRSSSSSSTKYVFMRRSRDRRVRGVVFPLVRSVHRAPEGGRGERGREKRMIEERNRAAARQWRVLYYVLLLRWRTVIVRAKRVASIDLCIDRFSPLVVSFGVCRSVCPISCIPARGAAVPHDPRQKHTHNRDEGKKRGFDFVFMF